MNLQMKLPRTGMGRWTMVLALVSILPVSSALYAQQSSSSAPATKAQLAAPAPAMTTLRDHLTFEGGAGGDFGAGLQNGQYVDPSFTFMGGAGYKLDRRLSVFVEGNYYHNKMPAPVLQTAAQAGGSYNMFTISGDPMFHFYQGGKFGAYAVAGGGFSSVATNFNSPISSTINCRVYSGLSYTNFTNFCNGTIKGSSYSTTQGMYDFGLGMDARLYPNRRESLFVESRYVKFMTPANQLPTPNLGLAVITGGVRW